MRNDLKIFTGDVTGERLLAALRRLGLKLPLKI